MVPYVQCRTCTYEALVLPFMCSATFVGFASHNQGSANNIENLQFMAEKLSAMLIIPTAQIEELAASLSCDPSVNVCMYRQCENCKHNTIETAAPYDPEKRVKYLQWKTAAEENGYIITVKVTKTQSLQDILETFQQTMERFCRRALNIRHQYREYRSKCDILLQHTTTEYFSKNAGTQCDPHRAPRMHTIKNRPHHYFKTKCFVKPGAHVSCQLTCACWIS